MAGAGRNDHGIAGFELDDDALFVAAGTRAAGCASDPWRAFVNSRVVMEIIVYPVAPGIAPPVSLDQRALHTAAGWNTEYALSTQAAGGC